MLLVFFSVIRVAGDFKGNVLNYILNCFKYFTVNATHVFGYESVNGRVGGSHAIL